MLYKLLIYIPIFAVGPNVAIPIFAVGPNVAEAAVTVAAVGITTGVCHTAAI